jgi:RNA polymerase-binding transcription factor DksA
MESGESTYFRQVLLARRAEIFDRYLGLESGWRALEERHAELEEEAQKEDLTSLYDLLAFKEKSEIEEIDRALLKIGEGTFGRCERCGKPISRARLEALPETSLCLSCARESETESRRPKPETEGISCSAAPSGYEDLSDEDLVELIGEALRNDGRVDMGELKITARKGKIRLDGILPNEQEHQIVLRTVHDFICSGEMMDRVKIGEVTPAGEEASLEWFVMEHGEDISPEVDEEKMTDNPFEMQEEDILFDVPDRPPAETFPGG